MNNNKQSSVDILCQKLANKLGLQAITFYIDHAEEIAEAKAMEKKQCVDFALKCMLNGLEPHQSTREVVQRLFDEDFNDSEDQK